MRNYYIVGKDVIKSKQYFYAGQNFVCTTVIHIYFYVRILL
jgi:hypothetical protein